MKKQLLIAAVAATMTSAAMADISITGDSKFEYYNVDISAAATYGSFTATASDSSNYTNMETNLKIIGKSGDTTAVVNMELNTHGDVETAGAIDLEDMYISTKVGDIDLKLGNYATGTSAILGEIDNGGRANNKVTASTTFSGVKVYVGDAGAAAGAGVTEVKGNMFYGVSADVAGFNVHAKHVSPTVDAFAISGEVSGLGIRLEQLNSDTTDQDVTFGNLTYAVNDIDLGYAWIDADSDGQITEDDSSIFAVEMAASNAQKTNVNGVAQISAKTSIAGNTVTVKAGTLEAKSGFQDADFTQVDVKRALASGATLALTYTNADTAAIATGTAQTDTSTFEADISVKF